MNFPKPNSFAFVLTTSRFAQSGRVVAITSTVMFLGVCGYIRSECTSCSQADSCQPTVKISACPTQSAPLNLLGILRGSASLQSNAFNMPNALDLPDALKPPDGFFQPVDMMTLPFGGTEEGYGGASGSMSMEAGSVYEFALSQVTSGGMSDVSHADFSIVVGDGKKVMYRNTFGGIWTNWSDQPSGFPSVSDSFQAKVIEIDHAGRLKPGESGGIVLGAPDLAYVVTGMNGDKQVVAAQLRDATVEFDVGLGLDSLGQFAGKLVFEAPSNAMALSTASVRWIAYSEAGVTPAENTAAPTQVNTATAQASITNMAGNIGVLITVRTPAPVSQLLGTWEAKSVAATGAPELYPAGIQITHRDAAEIVIDQRTARYLPNAAGYEYVTQDGHGGGTNTTATYAIPSPSNPGIPKTRTETVVQSFLVPAMDGVAAHTVTTRETLTEYKLFPWGEKTVRQTEDPSGANLVTEYQYYETHPGVLTAEELEDAPEKYQQLRNYGKLKSTSLPDGNWSYVRAYEHFSDTGTETFSPFGDYIPSGFPSSDPGVFDDTANAPFLEKRIDYSRYKLESNDAVSRHLIAGLPFRHAVTKDYRNGGSVETSESISSISWYSSRSAKYSATPLYPGAANVPEKSVTPHEITLFKDDDEEADPPRWGPKWGSATFSAGSYNFLEQAGGAFVLELAFVVSETYAFDADSDEYVRPLLRKETRLLSPTGKVLVDERHVLPGENPDRLHDNPADAGVPWVLESRVVRVFDSEDRETAVYRNGRLEASREYHSEHDISESDATGVVKRTVSLESGRPLSIVRNALPASNGLPGVPAEATTYAYENVTHQGENCFKITISRTAGMGPDAQTTTSHQIYDMSGRIVEESDSIGRTYSTVYTIVAGSGEKATRIGPGGTSEVVERYRDGRIKTRYTLAPESTDRVGEESFAYEMDSVGLKTTRSAGGAASPRVQITYTDSEGHVMRTESPAPNPGGTPQWLISATYYSGERQVRRITELGFYEVTEYALDGRVSAMGFDFNHDSSLDPSDADRFTKYRHWNETDAEGLWEVQEVTPYYSGTIDDSNRKTTTKTLVCPAAGVAVLHKETVIHAGEETTRATVVDTLTATSTISSSSNRTTQTGVEVYCAGRLMQRRDIHTDTGSDVYYEYYALGDLKRTFQRTTTGGTPQDVELQYQEFYPNGQLQLKRTFGGGDEAYEWYPADHYNAGLLQTMTNAAGSTTSYEYDLNGRVTSQYGSASYPVNYEYDAYGDLWKMYTSSATEQGVTTWNRDEATGVLISKQDSAANGASYTYEPDTGLLKKRTWARTAAGGAALSATYTYDDAGRLWKIEYSDDTPDVTHTYYADGRINTTLDGAGLHTYIYGGPHGALSGETITGGELNGASWSAGFDDQERRNSFTWTWASQSRITGFGYDDVGRLETVTAFDKTATYAYVPVSGRLDTLSYNGLVGDWDYDEHDRLDKVEWTAGANTVSLHDYGYDAMNRRESAIRETGEAWGYTYNERGEITGGAKAVSGAQGAATKHGLQFGYDYDPIGNRAIEMVSVPNEYNRVTSILEPRYSYSNGLNQIFHRTGLNRRWVLGHAKAEAQMASYIVREGDEFRYPLFAHDYQTPLFPGITVSATLPGAGRNGMDLTTTKRGRLWFGPNPEILAYDADGNLKSDGRWEYEWDAENRLKSMETHASIAAAALMTRQRLEFKYDAQGRRVRKVVKSFNPQINIFVVTSDLRFIYDGWNLMAEFESSATGPVVLKRAYAWGRDLSGTMQGAGGVGGLVFAQSLPTSTSQPSTTMAPCYDGNGNVSAYINVASGAVISRHDYDPFGRPVWTELEGSNGTTTICPFHFSMKYDDVETGLCYYGFRYYSPELGRWLSRDPIEEQGGINLYGFVGNDSVNNIDPCGLMVFNYQGAGWTNWNKNYLQERGRAIDSKMPSIVQKIQEWQDLADQLIDCCEYKKALVSQLKSIRTLADGIKSSSDTINARLGDLGDEKNASEVNQKNIFGRTVSRYIIFNYHQGDNNFFGNTREAEKTVFHELTHQHGAVDGGDVYNDAHRLEDLIDAQDSFATAIRNELIGKYGKKNCPYFAGEDAPLSQQWPKNE